LALMREAGKQELDYGKIEEVLKRDISLSYRLLKYINSSFFGLRNEIHSIRQALALLGERNVRKWVRLVGLSALGEDKSPELLQNSICRARFCEQLAERGGPTDRGDDLFLLGMFSLLVAIIDQPMAEVVEQVPLAADVKAALLGEANPLRAFLDLVVAYEQGEWGRVDACRQHVPVRTEDLPALYFDALSWADALVGMSSEAENTARAR
jgi:EAL and modified HD-GYP domain-containing signal transduction protein